MNDQHDEEYVDQKHFRYFTMAKSEQDTRNDNNIGYTHAVVQITKLFLPGPRPLPTLGHYALPERYKDLKWITKLNYWISICRGIVCATAAAAAKLEKSTATTNSGPHTHTYECASVCVCV